MEREERVDVEMPDVARPPSDATFVDLLDDELLRLQHIARLLVGNSDIADDLVAEAIARTLPKWLGS